MQIDLDKLDEQIAYHTDMLKKLQAIKSALGDHTVIKTLATTKNSSPRGDSLDVIIDHCTRNDNKWLTVDDMAAAAGVTTSAVRYLLKNNTDRFQSRPKKGVGRGKEYRLR